MSFSLKLHHDYPHFKEILESMPECFADKGETIHKARNEIKVMVLEGIWVVVKAFKIPNALNQFVYAYLRHSKAYKSFHNALKLQILSIPTPQPIGYIEFKHSGLFKESYFLSCYEPYDYTMAHIRDAQPEDRNEVLEAFARFTCELHRKGVWHVDYSAGNILVRRKEGGIHFSLVDINRMVFHPVDFHDGLKNFNKLWFNEADLTVIAKAYAKAAGICPLRAAEDIIAHDAALKRKVERKRRLKAWLKVE